MLSTRFDDFHAYFTVSGAPAGALTTLVVHAPSRTAFIGDKPPEMAAGDELPDLISHDHRKELLLRIEPGAFKFTSFEVTYGGSGGHGGGHTVSKVGLLVRDAPSNEEYLMLSHKGTAVGHQAHYLQAIAGVEGFLAARPPSPDYPLPPFVPQPPGSPVTVRLMYVTGNEQPDKPQIKHHMSKAFPRGLHGTVSFATWDAFASRLNLPKEEYLWPCSCPLGLLLIPPIACFGGICCMIKKITQSYRDLERRFSDLATEAAPPGWTVAWEMNSSGVRGVRITVPSSGGGGASSGGTGSSGGVAGAGATSAPKETGVGAGGV